jgi:heme-degrading monooxygenase HmoA
MIVRIWHGWTTPEDAEEYERLAVKESYDAIAERAGDGFRGFDVARREAENGGIEYVTITRFDSWEAVEAFAGEDPEAAYVPPEVEALLTDYDERVEHYELRDSKRV